MKKFQLSVLDAKNPGSTLVSIEDIEFVEEIKGAGLENKTVLKYHLKNGQIVESHDGDIEELNHAMYTFYFPCSLKQFGTPYYTADKYLACKFILGFHAPKRKTTSELTANICNDESACNCCKSE
jgi:hypothetical protein